MLTFLLVLPGINVPQGLGKFHIFKVMNQILFKFLMIVILGGAFGVTRQQLKKTMSIMKKQCMPKNAVNEDKVGKIEQGVFIEEHNVMCYIACVYKTGQVVKNNRLDKNLISKQIDMLYPQDLKEPVKKAVEMCVDIQQKYSDMCEGIFYATKCLYETDPANFVFP